MVKTNLQTKEIKQEAMQSMYPSFFKLVQTGDTF